METAKQQRGRPFPPGVSGNPDGRPVGSISIINRIKQIWAENPEKFESYVEDVMKDKMLRREIIQQVDGRPAQIIKGDSSAPLVIELIQYGNSANTVQLSAKDISAPGFTGT